MGDVLLTCALAAGGVALVFGAVWLVIKVTLNSATDNWES